MASRRDVTMRLSSLVSGTASHVIALGIFPVYAEKWKTKNFVVSIATPRSGAGNIFILLSCSEHRWDKHMVQYERAPRNSELPATQE